MAGLDSLSVREGAAGSAGRTESTSLSLFDRLVAFLL